MSFVVRGLLGVACVACPSLAQAQSAPAAPASAAQAPAAQAPAAPAPAAPAPAPAAPAPTAPPPVRVYIRNEGPPLTFSARAESGHGEPAWCISPCDARLAPGDYKLQLNSVKLGDTVKLRQPGTLNAEYYSHAGAREGAWLALNVGGIIGGVFLTVGLAGGPPTAFAVGGGVLAGATAIFFITYRADKAKVTFTPEPPPDVRGMPDPAAMSGSRQAALDRSSLSGAPRGLGFRIAF